MSSGVSDSTQCKLHVIHHKWQSEYVLKVITVPPSRKICLDTKIAPLPHP